jgi:hypothetical protein
MIRHDGMQFVNAEDPDDPAEVRREIEAHARRLLERFVAQFQYAPAEMASWAVLASEIKAYAASGNTADCPFCVAEATTSNLPLATVIERVSANTAAFSAFLALVKGARNKHKTAIAALTAPEVFAYDWRGDWPA